MVGYGAGEVQVLERGLRPCCEQLGIQVCELPLIGPVHLGDVEIGRIEERAGGKKQPIAGKIQQKTGPLAAD
jgi:hypothetical protein